jgi:HK97 family phage major capsid protein
MIPMPDKTTAAPTVSQQDVLEAIDRIGRAFEEHKKANDARLEAIRKEKATSDFDEKLDNISKVLNDQERIQRAWRKQQDDAEAKKAADEAAWKAAQEEHSRKLEARFTRIALGLGGGTSGIEGNPDEPLREKAFRKFIREGGNGLGPEEVKVLTQGTDTQGGYLGTPATFVAEVIKAEVLFSPVRSIVTVRQMGAAELQQPKRTGTASATRVGETQTRAPTGDPTWGMVKLSAPEMYAECRATLMQIEDSAFDMEALLRDEFAEQFGVLEGSEVISGNGVNKCLGILDANAAGVGVPIAFTVSGAAATIKGASGAEGDGVVNLFHAVKTAYAVNGRWILNRASLGKVRLLKDTTGQYLWQPGLVPGNPNSILGSPYTECPDMPDEGANTFPIAFGDWRRAYVISERIDMQVLRDPYSVKGQVVFNGRRRVGGQVVLGEAIRLLKCSA